MADGATATPQPMRHLFDKIDSGLDYTKSRKARFRRWATLIKLTSLAMSAAATVILGLVELTRPVAVAFILTALVTVLSALEPFFNHRARWVIMEEGRARFHRLRDDLEFAVASAPDRPVDQEALDRYHDRFQAIWDSMSEAWIDERRRARTVGEGP